MQQRQPGLDEGAGDLVQAALVVAGRVAAVELGLEQDQVDQADELFRAEPQHELVRFVLRGRKSGPSDGARAEGRGHVCVWMFDLTWRIFWSRPCQMRGM